MALWGFFFFSLISCCLIEETKTLSLSFPMGAIVIGGPKVLDFYNAFSSGKATLLKADGVDIISVELVPVGVDATQV